MSRLGGSTAGPGSAGGASPASSGVARPATVTVLLEDGPAGVYERVKIDVGQVTATDAAPATASSPDPPATGASSILVAVDLTATTAAENVFSAADFRLELPAGPPMAYSTVEVRLQADGRAVAPANSPTFEPIKPGSSGDRTHVFEVDATARSLAFTGPSGAMLGRWSVDLAAAPGEG